jgi:hypothetical protein
MSGRSLRTLAGAALAAVIAGYVITGFAAGRVTPGEALAGSLLALGTLLGALEGRRIDRSSESLAWASTLLVFLGALLLLAG